MTERAGVNAGCDPCILIIGRGATKWMVQTIQIGPPRDSGSGRKVVKIRRGRAAVTGDRSRAHPQRRAEQRSGGLAEATVGPESMGRCEFSTRSRNTPPRPVVRAPRARGIERSSGPPVMSPEFRGQTGRCEKSSASREIIGSMPAPRTDSIQVRTNSLQVIGGISCLIACLAWAAKADAQHATEVIEYLPGNASAPFLDPQTTLGPPTRMSGIPGVLPSTVTPFQPAFGAGELVTIGQGGRLTIAFDQPVTDDPGNPFGIDLLIFGNAFFISTCSAWRRPGPSTRSLCT